MPLTRKRKPDEQLPAGTREETQHVASTRFVHRNNWFVLAQTDGQDVAQATLPSWDRTHALNFLSIVEEPFAMTDGNCQGYARGRSIAISPLAHLPHKTRFHEVAHVVVGHTAEAAAGLTDSDITPRGLREVEAEAVALVCLEALGLPGAEHCRGYIQHWNTSRSNEPIPERSAQRVFKAADAILEAGEVATPGLEGGTSHA